MTGEGCSAPWVCGISTAFLVSWGLSPGRFLQRAALHWGWGRSQRCLEQGWAPGTPGEVPARVPMGTAAPWRGARAEASCKHGLKSTADFSETCSLDSFQMSLWFCPLEGWVRVGVALVRGSGGAALVPLPLFLRGRPSKDVGEAGGSFQELVAF